MTKGSDLIIPAALMCAVLVWVAPQLRRDGVVAQLLPGYEADAVVETVERVTRSGKRRNHVEWEVTARVVDHPDVLAFGSLRSSVAVGDPILARVPHARPDLALAWQQGTPPSLAGFWLALVFIAFSFTATAVRLWANWRDLRLLRDGMLTTGKLVERSSRTHRSKTTWTLTFRYLTGRAGEQTTRVDVLAPAQLRLSDEDAEPLVYDPARPRRALLLDALPDHLRVRADGSLTPVPWRRGLLRSIAPLATLAFFIVFLLMVGVFG